MAAAAGAAGPDAATVTATRRSLHAVAESLLAGPQHRASGTIRLRVVAGGFATTKQPDLEVRGATLVVAGRVLPLAGTVAALGAQAGVDTGPPRDLYQDHADLGPDEPLHVDPDAAALLAGWYAAGAGVLRELATGEAPVLWPEHFDLAVAVDEVNYGVSPGDGFCAEPYAYVGPWAADRRAGAFWNAPFGAYRTREHLPDPLALKRFFEEGRRLAAPR